MSNMFETIGYKKLAYDLRGDAMSGCYEDKINWKSIAKAYSDDYESTAREAFTPEEARKEGRRVAIAASVATLALGAVGGFAYTEATGRTDIVHVIPDGSHFDLGAVVKSSSDQAAQLRPTDVTVARF